MKYAIIAAGEGSRLSQEGVEAPKPLVEIDGERLIERLLRIFMDNNATEIVVICNALTTEVSSFLVDVQNNGLKGRPIPLRFVIKTTPSSMHSFYELSQFLEDDDEPFVLTTVDTIFKEQEFTDYVKAFKEVIASGGNGLMGVTDFIDDEKPLYVGVDAQMNITGFYDQSEDCRYISGGIYGLDNTAIKTLKDCIERGESRMRNFQRALVADGRTLKAYPFSKVLDIDHASDIEKAEIFLK